MSTVDDLTELRQLNEDTMLACLEQRYSKGCIYTYTGPVLLAVNPFAQVPRLYAMEYVQKCRTGTRIPHIFSIAQAAYDGISSDASHRHGFRNQSILISGESGAGKTETSKLVMKFLSLCGNREQQWSIERKILETNPLLESFGNAKTLRNDNSSRFGKFIQLHFADHKGCLKLSGARIETYLLEKVRVCSQSPGERSFHIFYQCCAAAASVGGIQYDFPKLLTSEEKFRLKLNGFAGKSNFKYLSSAPAELIDDLLEFERTVSALRVIGLSVREIEELLACVAAVLHVGNIEFDDFHDSAHGEACVISSKEPLYMACALLGISDSDILETALCTRGISVSASEGYRSPLSASKAAEVRDGFAKFLYFSIFSFLVEIINKTIAGNVGQTSNSPAFIGLLDIFGFEYFETNSFEQLCINYANERLQHLFVDHVLRAEQSVYAEEGIAWNCLDFPDNGGVLNLLHHPLTGVLPMLDEECRIVGGNDGNFLAKLVKTNSDKPEFFSTIKTKKDWFVVNHFAGSVAYKVSSGFVDKNRDTLSLDVVELCGESSILARLSAGAIERFNVGAQHQGGKVMRSKIYTVSSEFRGQLNDLMEIVSETRPLFVRCIKPNNTSEGGRFERNLVLEQLRYGGVLQAVQISRAGFPVRTLHAEFVEQFHCLFPKCQRTPHALAKLIGEGIVVGKSKVFLKQPVWDKLTEYRSKVRERSALIIQTYLRMVACRREFRTLKRVLVSVQSVVRTALVVRAVNRNKAAARIQAAFLAWTVRQFFLLARESAIRIQRAVRRKFFKRTVSVSRKRTSTADHKLVFEMEQLGKEIRAAKQTMKTVDNHPARTRLAYFNSGTPNQSYFAPHIPPAPFVPARRGLVTSRFGETENAPPVVRTNSNQVGKIGSIEKRVMKVHDDMARMKELIDRIQNNMSDL